LIIVVVMVATLSAISSLADGFPTTVFTVARIWDNEIKHLSTCWDAKALCIETREAVSHG